MNKSTTPSFNVTVKTEINKAVTGDTPPQDIQLAQLFLHTGFISDPTKDYRIEFHTLKHSPTQELLAKLDGYGINGHSILRGGRWVVYVTASEQIEDLLVLLGAQQATLALINTKIEKEMHNKANRLSNCDIANTEKTAQTNAAMVSAIKTLQKDGLFDRLPDKVQQAGLTLLAHEEYTLAELAAELGISKSGLHHRLSKIRELAKNS